MKKKVHPYFSFKVYQDITVICRVNTASDEQHHMTYYSIIIFFNKN